MIKDKEILKIREAFIEKIGLILQMEGMSRIAGRMLGLLVFDGTATSFGDLATQLKVSRGSVSANAKFLEERGLIERVSKPGMRQDFFQLANDPYATMIKGVVQRMDNAKHNIGETLDELSQHGLEKDQDCENIRSRLQDYMNFYDVMIINLMNAHKAIKE